MTRRFSFWVSLAVFGSATGLVLSAGDLREPEQAISDTGRLQVTLRFVDSSSLYRSAIFLVTLRNVGTAPIQVSDAVAPGRGLALEFDDESGTGFDPQPPIEIQFPMISAVQFEVLLGGGDELTLCYRWSDWCQDLSSDQDTASARSVILSMRVRYEIVGSAFLPEEREPPVWKTPSTSNVVAVQLSPGRVDVVRKSG